MLDPTGHDIPPAAELVEDEVARIRERARQDRAERWRRRRADLWALVTPGLRCVHRSHRLRLPCLRHGVYGRLCGVHGRCDTGCPREARRG